MPTIIELSCEFSYEAAHRLPYVPPGHKCAYMHGHSYHLTVTARGPVRDDGFVIDFADVKAAVNPVIDKLDHHCLNDILDNPTVENQLVWLWDNIDIELHALTLRETPRNSATYRGERWPAPNNASDTSRAFASTGRTDSSPGRTSDTVVAANLVTPGRTHEGGHRSGCAAPDSRAGQCILPSGDAGRRRADRRTNERGGALDVRQT
jgi:6-pyruvoyltetrahydropterin/6-carboxytetrahydropterin synthase